MKPVRNEDGTGWHLEREGADTHGCQHENAQGERDCDAPAVLCVHHGGHDACALDLMRVQAVVEAARALHLDPWAGKDAWDDLHRAFRDLDAAKGGDND